MRFLHVYFGEIETIYDHKGRPFKTYRSHSSFYEDEHNDFSTETTPTEFIVTRFFNGRPVGTNRFPINRIAEIVEGNDDREKEA